MNIHWTDHRIEGEQVAAQTDVGQGDAFSDEVRPCREELVQDRERLLQLSLGALRVLFVKLHDAEARVDPRTRRRRYLAVSEAHPLLYRGGVRCVGAAHRLRWNCERKRPRINSVARSATWKRDKKAVKCCNQFKLLPFNCVSTTENILQKQWTIVFHDNRSRKISSVDYRIKG